MIEVLDAIDRQVALDRPAARVVSLVPSETSSVAALVGVDRLVGRTDYCEEPAGRIERVPSVGGTKGFDVDAVRALEPDLVLANKEENSRPQVEAMIDMGLPVHVSFPCTVAESLEYLESLCVLLGVDPASSPTVRECRAAVERVEAPEAPAVPVFVPIWKDPWMTFDGGVYASDVLRLCGAANVFASRARQYPLAADLGRREPWDAERVADRDTRYPRIRLEEVAERGPALALLPNEPYPFTEEDAEQLRSQVEQLRSQGQQAKELHSQVEQLRSQGRETEAEDLRSQGVSGPLSVELIDGKDLFWYGSDMASAVNRLVKVIARLRERNVGGSAHN